MNGNGLQKIAVGVLIIVAATGIIGTIVMYGTVSAMQAKIDLLYHCIPSFSP